MCIYESSRIDEYVYEINSFINHNDSILSLYFVIDFIIFDSVSI